MTLTQLDSTVGLGLSGLICAALLLALVTFTYLERGGPRRPEDGPFFYRYYRWCMRPVARGLLRLGLTPNAVTALSLVIALVAAALVGAGLLLVGVITMVVASTCDVLDGVMARERGQTSRSGAFFDSFADRLAEGIILGGIAYYGQGQALTWVAFFTMVTSFAVSYARARGESLGVDVSGGVMQRPARLVTTMIAIFVAGVAGALPLEGASLVGQRVLLGLVGLVGVLALYTSLSRARATMIALDASSQAPTTPTTPVTPAVTGASLATSQVAGQAT